jgi:hypothetical protein
VDGRVVPIVGGFENKTHSLESDNGQKLVVRGYAVMGAVVIRN